MLRDYFSFIFLANQPTSIPDLGIRADECVYGAAIETLFLLLPIVNE